MSEVVGVERPEGWERRLLAEWGPGGFPVNSTSGQLEASRVVKAGAGSLLGFSGFNSGAAAFVLAVDTQAVLANGMVGVVVLSVGAASNFSYNPGNFGRAFHQGIVLAVSSTEPALTLAGAVAFFDAQYL